MLVITNCILLQDMATQSLSLDMINSVEDAVCEIAGSLANREDDLELLVGSAQTIFDQARHSQDVAHPSLQWLQQRILMLMSKVEFRCLAVISHADDAAGQALQPMRTQLRDARIGRVPITPRLLDSCASLLLPAMAACPSFQVRAMMQRTQKNLSSLRELRQELLAEVSQMLHAGAGKLLNFCQTILQAGACSPDAMAQVQQALSDAYTTFNFTHATLNTCRPCFQDLANRRIGSSHEMLRELAHQDMLLTICARYSDDRQAVPVSASVPMPAVARQIAPRMPPAALVQSMLSPDPRAASPGLQPVAQAAAAGSTSATQPFPLKSALRPRVDAALDAQPPSGTRPPIPAHQLASHRHAAQVSVAGLVNAKPPAPSGGQRTEDWAGEDLIRGLLQSVTRNTAPRPTLPSMVQQVQGPPPQPSGLRTPANQPKSRADTQRPSQVVAQPSQILCSEPPSTRQVDPLDMWSLLQNGP